MTDFDNLTLQEISSNTATVFDSEIVENVAGSAQGVVIYRIVDDITLGEAKELGEFFSSELEGVPGAVHIEEDLDEYKVGWSYCASEADLSLTFSQWAQTENGSKIIKVVRS